MRRFLVAALLSVALALVALAGLLAVPAPSPEVRPPAPVSRAVRVVVDREDARLEVASRGLVGEDGRSVWLVGMVHVADPVFYAQIDRLLAGSEAVLVEGLAPDPDRPPEPDDDVAVDLARLSLAFQGDALPWREGWRRSDLEAAEVRRALVARGIDPGPWLDDRDRDALRRVLAGATDPRTTALARLAVLSGLAGEPPTDEAWEAVIVGLRDAAVVEDALDEPGSVAIVYGADHLPDLEARLVARGFSRTEERWLTAIGVSYAALGLGPVQVRQLLQVE